MCATPITGSLPILAWERRTTSTSHRCVALVTERGQMHNMVKARELFGKAWASVVTAWLLYFEPFMITNVMMRRFRYAKQSQHTVFTKQDKPSLSRVGLSGALTQTKKRSVDMIRKIAIATMCLILGTSAIIIGIAHIMQSI